MATLLDRPMRPVPGPAVPEQPPVRRAIGAAIATIAIVLVLAESVADALPDDPIRFNVTPVRLAIILGLVGVCFAGVMVRSLRTRLDLPILALLAAAGLATVLHSQSFAGWRGLLAGVAAYYLAVGARRGGALSFGTLSTIALVFVAVPAGVALGQASNQTSTGFCRSGLGGELSNVCNDPDAMVRVVGTFYNPNLLAAFLVMVLPLAVVGALGVADRSLRALAFTVIGGSYIAILATFSRGGMAAAFVGAVLLVVLLKPTRRRLAVAGGAAAVGGLLLVFLMVVRGGGVGVRTEVWSAALRVAVENPLGTGLGLSGHLVAGRVPGTEAFVHVHNLWLNWLVETGVVGGVAVVAITVLVAIRVGRASLAGSKMAAALAGGLASFAVVSTVDHPANSMAISLVMWLMLGLAETSSEPSPLLSAMRHKGRRAARRSRALRS